MQIIKSTEHHLDQLVPLFDEYRAFCGFPPSPEQTRAFLAGLLQREASVIFIALDPDTDRVMGFVNLYPSYSTLALQRLWILNDLAVSADFRGRNVSKALISKAMEYARETNAVRIELKTETSNARAQNLYKGLGFTIDQDNVYYRVPC